MELKDLRTRIDHIDDQLIDLFRARMDVSSEIAALQGMLANDGLAGEEMR